MFWRGVRMKAKAAQRGQVTIRRLVEAVFGSLGRGRSTDELVGKLRGASVTTAVDTALLVDIL